MNNINYKSSLFVSVIAGAIPVILLSSNSFTRGVMGCEGWGGMYCGIVIIFFGVPLASIIAGVHALWKNPQAKLHAFILFSILCILVSGVGLYIQKILNDQQIEQYYNENPLAYPNTDPRNPFTFVSIQPSPSQTKLGDTVEVVVSAHEALEVQGALPVRMEVIAKQPIYRDAPNGGQVLDREERIVEIHQINTPQKLGEKDTTGRNLYRVSVEIPTSIASGSKIVNVRIFFADFTIEDSGGFVNLYQSS